MRRGIFVICCIGAMGGLAGCSGTKTATPLSQKEADDAACEAAGYVFATYQYNECRQNLRAQRGEEGEPDAGGR